MICHGFFCSGEKIPSGDGVETLAAKPEFGTIVATTGQAAEHIAVACQYGAWKIAVMEQSPGVLRAVVGWGEAGRETEPGDELPGKDRSMPHAATGRHCGLSFAAEHAPSGTALWAMPPNAHPSCARTSEGNTAAAAFPNASTQALERHLLLRARETLRQQRFPNQSDPGQCVARTDGVLITCKAHDRWTSILESGPALPPRPASPRGSI